MKICAILHCISVMTKIVNYSKAVVYKFVYFILYSENQCISKLDKIGIFIDMKFH